MLHQSKMAENRQKLIQRKIYKYRSLPINKGREITVLLLKQGLIVKYNWSKNYGFKSRRYLSS